MNKIHKLEGYVRVRRRRFLSALPCIRWAAASVPSMCKIFSCTAPSGGKQCPTAFYDPSIIMRSVPGLWRQGSSRSKVFRTFQSTVRLRIGKELRSKKMHAKWHIGVEDRMLIRLRESKPYWLGLCGTVPYRTVLTVPYQQDVVTVFLIFSRNRTVLGAYWSTVRISLARGVINTGRYRTLQNKDSRPQYYWVSSPIQSRWNHRYGRWGSATAKKGWRGDLIHPIRSRDVPRWRFGAHVEVTRHPCDTNFGPCDSNFTSAWVMCTVSMMVFFKGCRLKIWPPLKPCFDRTYPLYRTKHCVYGVESLSDRIAQPYYQLPWTADGAAFRKTFSGS